jgi:hypothetical protein
MTGERTPTRASRATADQTAAGATGGEVCAPPGALVEWGRVGLQPTLMAPRNAFAHLAALPGRGGWGSQTSHQGLSVTAVSGGRL